MRVALKYGCNPHQNEAAFESGDSGPVRVLAGTPSMINMLDALNAWQLVAELKDALDAPAAASFKHVSPAGAAIATPLPEDLRRAYEVGDRELTPLATAYVRARGADPKCSFGDFVALSDRVDEATADYLRGVVSDGVIAPGFEPQALATLAAKKGGSFIVIEADPQYRPPATESREVFGVTLTQDRNSRRIAKADLDRVVCGTLTDEGPARPALGPHHLEVHAIEFRGLRLGRSDDRHWSGATITCGLHQTGRREGQTSGIWGGIRKCLVWSSLAASNARTASTGGCAISKVT